GKRAKPAETTYFDTFFTRTAGGLFEFPSVTRTMSPTEAIAAFPGRTFDDFKIDPADRRVYLQKYFGSSDGRSSVRALEVIERAAQERGRDLVHRDSSTGTGA